jgi:hypothetical protein
VIFVLIGSTLFVTGTGRDEDWLSFEKGEVLYTDGVPIESEYEQLTLGPGLNIDVHRLSLRDGS